MQIEIHTKKAKKIKKESICALFKYDLNVN